MRASKRPSRVFSLVGENGPLGSARIIFFDGASCRNGRQRSGFSTIASCVNVCAIAPSFATWKAILRKEMKCVRFGED